MFSSTESYNCTVDSAQMHGTVHNFVLKVYDFEDYNRERNSFNIFQTRRCKVGGCAMNVPLKCADVFHPLATKHIQCEI